MGFRKPAAVAVNTALLEFYWELGTEIVERQKTSIWGSGFLKQLSADLMAEFPDMKGFSEPNLRFIRRWVLFYLPERRNSVTACDRNAQQPAAIFMEQLVPQLVKIPWGHNRVIINGSLNLLRIMWSHLFCLGTLWVHKTDMFEGIPECSGFPQGFYAIIQRLSETYHTLA